MSEKNKIPPGFKKVEVSIAGFWKPEKVGQSIQGVINEAITTQGKDGDNTFYTLTLTPDVDGEVHAGPITKTDKDGNDVPVKPASGMLIGLYGKMLLAFLRGREGREVHIV